MLKKMGYWWVPVGSFALAVLLSLVAGPSRDAKALRSEGDETAQEKKFVCLKIFVIQDDNNGKGGSKYKKCDAEDKTKLNDIVNELNKIYNAAAKVCFTFDKDKDITCVQVNGAFDDKGNFNPDDNAAQGKLFEGTVLGPKKEDSKKCINLIFIEKFLEKDVHGNTPKIGTTMGPMNANASEVDDKATVNDIAHEVGHQFMLDHFDPTADQLKNALKDAKNKGDAEKAIKDLIDPAFTDNLMFSASKSYGVDVPGIGEVKVEVKRGAKLNDDQVKKVREKACDPTKFALNNLPG